jgi:hypothetical protein
MRICRIISGIQSIINIENILENGTEGEAIKVLVNSKKNLDVVNDASYKRFQDTSLSTTRLFSPTSSFFALALTLSLSHPASLSCSGWLVPPLSSPIDVGIETGQGPLPISRSRFSLLLGVGVMLVWIYAPIFGQVWCGLGLLFLVSKL